MTAQREIESVLAEIDAILEESGPRLPWVMSNDLQQQRQMLARARELLAELQQAQPPEAASPEQAQPSAGEGATALNQTTAAASQVLKALLQEMQYLRGQTMQILDPLRNEVTTLKQQRELLLQEVQQLQQQRLQLEPGQSPSLSAGQWEEMLQQLTRHLEAHLSNQLRQSVKQLEASAASTYLLTQQQNPEANLEATLAPGQRLEYLKQIQSQSDQLVLNLDRVLRSVFESLQQSIYSYQDSLSHGLNKMHTLGQQGEMMFNALINHLAQQMNQDTLAYLEATQARSNQPRQLPHSSATEPQPSPETAPPAAAEEDSNAAEFDFDDVDLDLALNDDEVTLLQIDDEISQLQLDVENLAEDYDPTREPGAPSEATATPPEPTLPEASSLAESSPGPVDPLQVLSQLEEAAPDPSANVSLPDKLEADTLDAVSNAAELDAAEADLDDLYQSIFGNVVGSNAPFPGVEEEATGEGGEVSEPAAAEPQARANSLAAAFPEPEPDAADSITALDDVAALLANDTADLPNAEPSAAPTTAPLSPDEAPLDELFGDGTAAQLTEAEAPIEPEADIINSLDELRPDVHPAFSEASELSATDLETDTASLDANLWQDEDDFVAASDEDLLTSDNLPNAERYWLSVDQSMIDQLDEDLTDLEAGLSASEPAPSPPSNLIEDSFANFGAAAAEPEPPTSEAAPDTPIPPSETLEDSFASFGETAPEQPTSPTTREESPVSFGSPAEENQPPPPAADTFGSQPGVNQALVNAANMGPFLNEDLWQSPPDATPPPSEPAAETLDDSFAAFGDSAPPVPPENEPTYPDQVPPYPINSPGEIPGSDAVNEDNRMPTGDLPSQETIEALFSDLNLSLGSDEAAVGESGLTLDALDALASQPENQTGETVEPPLTPPPAADQPPAQPEQAEPAPRTSFPSEASPDISDPSLTLENLLGELRLEPLFPDSLPADAPPPVTAENVFGAEADQPGENTPATADEETGIDLFGETAESGTFPSEPATESGGIDLFGEPAPAEPAPINAEPEGIDLFGEPAPAEPAPMDAEPEGIDLFGEPAPAESNQSATEASGIDLFGESPPAESAPAGSEAGGLDLFGEPAQIEADQASSDAEGINLFGDATSETVESPDEGDLFGGIIPEPPPTAETSEAGIDLFGETTSDSPSPPSSQGEVDTAFLPELDLSLDSLDLDNLPEAPGGNAEVTVSDADNPPITLDDLDLNLGDDQPAAEPPSLAEGPHPPETSEDLFGGSFGDEAEPSAPSAGPESVVDLFPEASAGPPAQADQPPANTVDRLFGNGADDEAATPAASDWAESEDLFGDSFSPEATDQAAASPAPGYLDENVAAADVSAAQSSPASDAIDEAETEVNYTEWLSDISLENILGTASDFDGPVAAVPPGDDEANAAEGDAVGVEDLFSEPAPAVEESSSEIMEDSSPEINEPAEPAPIADFDLPDTEPAGGVVSGPTGPVTEQDFFNLDALLDENLATTSKPPEAFDGEAIEDSFDSEQNFETEVDFIDLDALLANTTDGEDAAPEPGIQPFDIPSEGDQDADSEVDFSPESLLEPDLPPAAATEPEPIQRQDTAETAETAEPGDPAEFSDLLFEDAPGQEVPTEPLTDLTIPDDLVQESVAPPDNGEAEHLAAMPETPAADQAVPEEDEVGLPPAATAATAATEAPELWLAPEADSIELSDIAAEAQTTEAAPPPLDDEAVFPGAIDAPTIAEPAGVEPPAYPPAGSDSDLGIWFLGLDIGAQGVSAVLLQRHSGQVFPLYWVDNTISGATADKFFRLPTIASVAPADQGYAVQSVGSSALMVNWEEDESAGTEDDTVLVKSLKPFLKIGMPFEDEATGQPQPMIQWADDLQLPLQIFEESLQGLLNTLLHPAAPNSSVTVGAIGLESDDIAAALQDLQGVIVSYPANWPDTYPFNLREAVIKAGLVDRPDDIYFLEDAIAAVLSGLPDPTEPPPTVNGQPVQQQTLYACHWTGGTVVISAGALVTEMGLANIPENLGDLNYHDFALQSMTYAGDAIDLDIICHLLHPAERRQPRNPDRYRSPSNTEGWSWQAAMPELEEAQWDDLDLDSLEFPRAAEPDLPRRYRLQQRLESSLLGQSLLEAVRHLKIILQHQPQFELELADQRWMVRSKDLEDRIILPYIQRINGHLNRLLSEVGLNTQAINQVICTGGNASLPKISRWLRQKFPNATIIQDTYHSDRPPSCSRVAYGLVNLLRYPQVLDLTRHQYSDMFLLIELLRTFPDQPMPLSGILHLLKERGINTEACELHIIALLEGRLPPGLLPAANHPLVRLGAENSTDLQALLTTPLFSRPNGQVYVPNPDQCQRLRAYMEALLADKHQQLVDPLLARLVALAV